MAVALIDVPCRGCRTIGSYVILAHDIVGSAHLRCAFCFNETYRAADGTLFDVVPITPDDGRPADGGPGEGTWRDRPPML